MELKYSHSCFPLASVHSGTAPAWELSQKPFRGSLRLASQPSVVLLLVVRLLCGRGYLGAAALLLPVLHSPTCLWPPLSPPVCSGSSHLVGEVTMETKPLETPGWDFIRPGAPGDECPGRGAVGNRVPALALVIVSWNLERIP